LYQQHAADPGSNLKPEVFQNIVTTTNSTTKYYEVKIGGKDSAICFLWRNQSCCVQD